MTPLRVSAELPMRAMPKSATLTRAAGGEQDVGRRDVAVHDVVLVRDLQGVEDGEDRRHGLAGRHAPVPAHPLLEALAVDVLHGDVRTPSALPRS